MQNDIPIGILLAAKVLASQAELPDAYAVLQLRNLSEDTAAAHAAVHGDPKDVLDMINSTLKALVQQPEFMVVYLEMIEADEDREAPEQLAKALVDKIMN